jgi:hypothetical protein
MKNILRNLLTVAVIGSACATVRVASADPDPCALVSVADASKTIGAPVTHTRPRVIGTSFSCNYRSASFSSLVVTIEPFSSPAEATSTFHDTISSPMTQMSPSLALPGIGDEAHRLGPMIYVRKKSTIYAFSIVGRDANGAGADRVVALARSTVSRL